MLANYNNGIAEGLSTYWHENGKKSAEIIYTSGDLPISGKAEPPIP